MTAAGRSPKRGLFTRAKIGVRIGAGFAAVTLLVAGVSAIGVHALLSAQQRVQDANATYATLADVNLLTQAVSNYKSDRTADTARVVDDRLARLGDGERGAFSDAETGEHRAALRVFDDAFEFLTAQDAELRRATQAMAEFADVLREHSAVSERARRSFSPKRSAAWPTRSTARTRRA